MKSLKMLYDDVPCLTCKVEHLCQNDINQPVNPINCKLFDRWLEGETQ